MFDRNKFSNSTLGEVQDVVVKGETRSIDEINKGLNFFVGKDDSVIEIRAIPPKGASLNKVRPKKFLRSDHTDSRDFKASIAAYALKMNERGYNMYIVMNPIKKGVSRPVRDEDIACRRLLLIDIDRKEGKSGPATKADLQVAMKLAKKIRLLLKNQGYAEPTLVMSGNGFHLYYRLGRLENTRGSATLIKNTLNFLAQQFDNDRVCVDTSVYNASRITKLPGTIMRKGQESEDRPFRMAKVMREGDGSTVSQDQLQRVVSTIPDQSNSSAEINIHDVLRQASEMAAKIGLVAPQPENIQRQVVNASSIDWSECPENISKVKGMLDHCDPEQPYEVWRNIIWSVCSLDWECGEKLITEWSTRSEIHWDDPSNARDASQELQKLIESFDPDRGVTIGTLVKYAQDGGWSAQNRLSVYAGHMDTAEAAANEDRYRIYSRIDLKNLPATKWIVNGLIPEQGIGAIYGPSGSSKTFLTLDLLIHICEGRDWFCREVLQRDVLYICLEGKGGITKRIEAWEIHNKTAASNLKVVFGDFNLLYEDDVTRLIDSAISSLRPGAVICIDTLNQASPGGDENNSTDMGRIIASVKKIAEAFNGFVFLVHHTGKDRSKGLRGHSSLRAALDVSIEVKREVDCYVWKTDKMKDGDGSVQKAYDLAILTTNQGINPETSCAVHPIDQPKKVRKPTGKNQVPIYEAIVKALEDEPHISRRDALKLGKDALIDVNPNNRTDRAKTSLDALISGGYFIESKEEISLP